MALTIGDRIKNINPDIGVIENVDGVTYRVGVEDVNSDEILTAAEAINTALQDAGITQLQLADIVTATEATQAAVEAQGEGAYTTPTHTNPNIAAATTVALEANANRLYALLINDSAETLYLKLGADAVLNQGIRLNANGGSYEMSRELGNLYVGAINGIGTSGTAALLVTWGE